MQPGYAGLRGLLPARAQSREKFGRRKGVQDVRCTKPGAAKLADTVSPVADHASNVGVGVHNNFAAALLREPQIAVAEVEAFRRCVVLHRNAELGTFAQNGAGVELVGLTPQELSAGGMAKNMDVRILDRPEDPGGHLVSRLLEAAVDAGNHNVHLGQHFVGEVESSIGKNVHLDAGEDADATLHLLVDLTDALQVLKGPLIVEAVNHGQVLRVVGDRDVLHAAGDGCFSHLSDGVVAVAGGGVHVEIALDVRRLDETGQVTFCRGLDFAEVLAHLRRNPVHLESGIDLFFGSTCNYGLVIQTRQRPFAEGVAHLERALAKGDIVGFGAGKVLKSCAIAIRREQADVDLEAVCDVEADLVFSLGDNVADSRVCGDVLYGGVGVLLRAGRAGDKQVEVARCFAAPPHGSRGRDAVDSVEGKEISR